MVSFLGDGREQVHLEILSIVPVSGVTENLTFFVILVWFGFH